MFVGFELLYQTLWAAVDRPKAEFNQCVYNKGFTITYIVIKVVVAIVGTILSFRIRNEKSFERDSKYNIVVFAILLVVAIVFAPILLLSTQTTRQVTITTQIISIPVGALLVSSGAMITYVAPYIHSLFQKSRIVITPFTIPKAKSNDGISMVIEEKKNKILKCIFNL